MKNKFNKYITNIKNVSKISRSKYVEIGSLC